MFFIFIQIYSGHRIGPILVPRNINEQDFDVLVSKCSNRDDREKLQECYEKDENSTPSSYTYQEYTNSRDELLQLFYRLMDQLETDKLWQLFAPSKLWNS